MDTGERSGNIIRFLQQLEIHFDNFGEGFFKFGKGSPDRAGVVYFYRTKNYLVNELFLNLIF